MKFGKTYLTHQIPEWSIYYMNYKHLKKIIKSIDSIKNSDIEFDENKYPEIISETLSSFFFEIDRNIEDVDEFFNNKFKEYKRRLNKIISVLNFKDNLINYKIESKEELDEIISILIELRILFRNLKWFGELNHKGFIKILKKLDKKLTSILNEGQVNKSELSNNNKEAYLSTRIDALPFANETELSNNLDIIHKILLQLGTLGFNNNEEIKLESLNLNTNLESFQQILEEDNVEELSKELLKNKNDKFNISLLNKAALNNSTKCIDLIWENLNNLYDNKDINGRNFFHQNIISLGKKQFIKEEQLTPGDSPNWLIGSTNGSDNNNINNTSGLLYILNKLDDKDKNLIISKDHYNRTPLHYSAQYGLVQVTNILLDFYTKWKLIDKTISIDNIDEWGDQESLTPLHLSIIGKHPKTTEILIKFNSANTLTCPDLLLLSVKLNSSRILNSLINDGKIDINYTNIKHRNETALYIATKLNLYDVVEFLLESNSNTEIGEKIFGWTPIFIAACEGYKSIVQLLIDYDANHDIVDDSGWLPMEHACLRGHLEVADLLRPKNENLLLYDTYHPEKNLPRIPSEAASPLLQATTHSKDDLDFNNSIDKLPESHKHAVNEFYKQLKNNNSSNNVSRSVSPKRRKKYKPIKSFGHRYLGEDEKLILITLGTTDLRDDNVPVELNKISLAKSFATELDTALSLSITCRHKLTNQPVEPSVVVDLPLEDYHGSATDPITFKLNNNLQVEDIIITFDLIPTYQVNKKILGRAIALLKDAYTKVGPNLRSLNNNITIPIIESTNLDILGLIRFEYLQVLPFKHHAMNIARSDTYWKQLVSTRVIGHRGLGKNESGRQSLQLGENTVESFIAAASLGASYVEFDVQLTKDLIPVVYHDFTVAESGVDIPMHLLTLEQFLGLNKTREKTNHSMDDEILIRSKPRAKSSFQLQNGLNHHTHHHNEDFIDKEFESQINERMKLTKTWKNKGYKGNARGTSIASNFVTLKDLFKKLPKNVGFNIELKYPMLDEAEQESMGEISIDLNLYLDTILKLIYDENLNNRHIVFSSFHPDVCLLLSLKQPTMPILFLTEAGTAKMADIRASSLQNAIRFAKKWNLLGIVSAAKTLVKTPRLAQVIKSSGLVCVTYGVENNEPELAKIQMRAGVDAVIVDSVLAVREGLREHNNTVKEFEDSSNSE
ncbi:GDE1 [Candida pseudojiufengensis]|uniref:GDE1 n=1 Tax=Candida pseudojiufengensis TaxID=497109 RepID=UPI00222442D4|nr:GDE1 [Candida pseudojiufengensis]KAI5968177.1 GDE1 [Candida pseudojiufengensis]